MERNGVAATIEGAPPWTISLLLEYSLIDATHLDATDPNWP
jgi:hypothetical protein